MPFTRRTLTILALVGVVAFLLAVAGWGSTSAGSQGKLNSMNQMKTVQPCTAQTTLLKVSDKPLPPDVGADPGETITYTVTETNNAEGSCLLDTNSDGVMDTLRVTGTYTLENRSGAGSGHINNPCNPADPRETCVLDVLDWVETHTAGQGNLWHVVHANGVGTSETHSGNQLDGQRNVDYYCPTDSSGPMPDLDGDTLPGGGNTTDPDKCSPSAQWQYGTLVTTLAPNTSLPCGQPGGSSCFGAPQVYKYALTVPLGAGQADMLASSDGIRNVAHFDMFNEELTNSGRNHFTRASFTSASLGSNAYNVTITDTPPQAPGDGDSCTANWPFTSCTSTATGWVANGATLPGGASGTVEIKYQVRDDECETVITNVANATHTDVTGTKVSDEGPASADTRIRDCPRLTVNKDLVPGLDLGLFNLQIDGSTEAADVGAGGTTPQERMTIGVHTAGETAGTGTDLADYQTAIGGDCAADGSIALKAGDIKTCTATNLRKPKLTVCKELVPSDDPGLFNLLIDGITEATDVRDGGCTEAVVVDIGAHTVGETAGTGTDLGDYFTPSIGGACTDNGAGTGSITLGPGENKTCVITNTNVPTLTVVKTLDPTTDSGTFRLKIDGGFVTACLGATSSAAIPVSISGHTVSEVACGTTNPSDYTATIDGDCDAGGNVTVAAGENKTCTITNSRKPTLEVRKILSPTTDPGKFNLWIGSTKYASDVGNGGTTGALVFAPDTYTVSETAGAGTNLADYDTVIGSECTAGGSVTLVPGDVKVCTITNTRKVVTAWTAHSQGFWSSNNGPPVYDKNNDGSLDTTVSIGGVARGITVGLVTNTVTVLNGVGGTTAQKAACLLVVGNEDCTPLDAKPKDVVSRADLAKLMGHTMALELNIVYLNGGVTTARISDIGEPKCTDGSISASLTKLTLTTSSTVGDVRSRANGLINNSPSGGVETTGSEMTAMIEVLGQCVNTNHAVVPGDRDWDGVPEDVDTCPGIYNPDQSDVDGDGIGDDCDSEMDNDSRGVTVGGLPVFRDDAEAYMGTDERRDCGLDAWGPDFNGDWTVDIFDVADIKAHFSTAAGNPAYTPRDDLSADGYINIVDLAIMKRFFFQTCAGVDPIQPGAP